MYRTILQEDQSHARGEAAGRGVSTRDRRIAPQWSRWESERRFVLSLTFYISLSLFKFSL